MSDAILLYEVLSYIYNLEKETSRTFYILYVQAVMSTVGYLSQWCESQITAVKAASKYIIMFYYYVSCS